MDEHDGHKDLCDLNRRSVISYVQGGTRVALLKSALPDPTYLSAPRKWHPTESFIAQGRVVYNEPPKPDRWPWGR
jgi:hypothetical protein